MKKLFKLDGITLEGVLKKNTIHNVYMTVNKSETELLPQSFKAVLLVIMSWLVSLYTLANGYIFLIISTCIIFSMFILYFKSPIYLKKSNYAFLKYICVQNAVIFYISSLQVTSSLTINKILALLYITASYGVSLYFCYTKLGVSIQERYLPEDKQERKIVNANKITKILLVAVVLIVGGMQFYRFNKWWLKDNNSDFLSGLNGTLMGDFFSILAVIIAVSVIMLITLIPTLFLNSEAIVNGLVLKKFSEEIRMEYDFSKKEWYGE